MESFLTSQRDSIFRQVHSLIYIFDVESPHISTTDMHTFVDCLAALKTNSTTGSTIAADEPPFVHVLIHKMDLVSVNDREVTFNRRRDEVVKKCSEAGWTNVRVFGTSIWDETLYKVPFFPPFHIVCLLFEALMLIISPETRLGHK
jgi:Ras-related GTP-binding protein A/B